MAYAMTKQGSLDNCVTYEFICDAIEDMNAIEDRYRTIGTVAIVLSGTSGLEVYIAGSDKQWNSLSSIGANSGSSEVIIDGGGFSIHICSSSEIRFGRPNISAPDEKTIYLIPAEDASSGNLYDEYIYVNNKWEKFGSGGNIDLSDYVTYQDLDNAGYATHNDLNSYAPIRNPNFTESISLDRKSDSNIGFNSTAVGSDTIASGSASHAEGNSTTASGKQSHAEGYYTTASSDSSHAEGYRTSAYGMGAHTEGGRTSTKGSFAHAEGYYTEANTLSHVSGIYNVNDSSTANIPTWAPHTEYKFLDRVRADYNDIIKTYVCITAHTSSNSFNNDINKWTEQAQQTFTDYNVIADIHNFAEIVGNGESDSKRSNARALDWHGNEYLNGDLYVHCNAKSAGGVKVISNMQCYKAMETQSNIHLKGGQYIWTRGENIYYNDGIYSYILDKNTHTWTDKTWQTTASQLPALNGHQIWTDGIAIYYTDKKDGTYQLSGDTWRKISSSNALNGSGIWTDGENYYYNSEYKISVQPTFNVQSQTWEGLTNFYGTHIWTDGEHIYYSNGTEQYILNKAINTWEPQIWNGLTQFYGEYVWTDKETIYYSSSTTHYVLDKTTNTWNAINWNNLVFSGDNVWTDNINIYYTDYYNNEYQLFPPLPKKILVSDLNNNFIPISVEAFMKENSLLPIAPSTDGTYTLQVTVTNGTPTYSWISAG